MKKYRISVQYFYCWANKDTGIWDVNTTKLVIKLEDNIIKTVCLRGIKKILLFHQLIISYIYLMTMLSLVIY